MKTKLAFLVSSLFFAATLFSYAGGKLDIYLYGNREAIPYFVQSQVLYVEKSAFLKDVGLPSNFTFAGKELVKDGSTYVSLAAAANDLHSQLLVNWQTGIVDLSAPASTGFANPIAPSYEASPSSSGPIEVIPPSAYQPWANTSPVSNLPLNPLPPPAVNVEPLVGNPWYNYPSNAPDPYYGAENPALYDNYGGAYPYGAGYGGYGYSYHPPQSIQPPAHMEGGILPVDSRGLPVQRLMGPGLF